ncbi:exodeoxyribonuclease VII large subunit [Methanofollis fontis]|uniref:Exodeoxyribonuclease VII large subunit n=1 Tax=Methanofollis fontis TaxID=2052832 RepID=A0A483CU19_9EURY|nr:exodeoxyribonuclease VII large subunit [Methanofollis fontis]TAJ44828.1 exodeoxyribonuclease VII large subunit [Methanofollis fontis]
MGLSPRLPGSDTGTVLSVSEVTGIIKNALDIPPLSGCWIRGEITNCKRYPSGHIYFSLSEGGGGRTAVISAVMFRGNARALSFEPGNGMDVVAYGNISFYEAQGRCQFYVEDLRRSGEGERHLLVERWKRELANEGLFSSERKRTPPRFPRRIAVVTSPKGAVFHDIQNVISRRYPLEILLSPTAVQGELAHLEIASAIRRADGLADVMIVGRGGGSFEDLFPFNRPEVVRAIAACRTPVISAVGHETDTTLADLAADLRAPTPSAAAELAVPDRGELLAACAADQKRLREALFNRIDRCRDDLEGARLRFRPGRAHRRIQDSRMAVAEIEERLLREGRRGIERRRLHLAELRARLSSRDPFAPLSHGYALLFREGTAIRSVREIAPGERLELRLADGSARVRVEEVDHAEDL